MKFIVDNWYLILTALVSGALLLLPMARRGAGVGTGEAVRLINREKGVLIDVAEPDDFAAGHATGARNVPLSAIQDHKALPSNKNLPLIVLCPTGTRAGRAAGLLRKAGYQNVQPVIGGTKAWREASLPVEKSASAASA